MRTTSVNFLCLTYNYSVDFFPPFLLEFMFFMIFFKSFGIASLIVVEVPFCMHYQENIDELIIM